MSPEQARGAEQVDARTDVWSMGVLMYQCLTGGLPFASRNYNALMVEIMTQAHRPVSEQAPGVDRTLAVIVEGCLVKDRAHRIASASELAERLAAVARRLGRADEGALEGPRRRTTDRLPPVRGVVGAFERPSNAQLGRSRVKPMSARRLASYAGLAGLLVGAASVYALVTWRAGSEGASSPDRASAAPTEAASGKSGGPSPVAQRTTNSAR
jgi:serine/threonine protein kinase